MFNVDKTILNTQNSINLYLLYYCWREVNYFLPYDIIVSNMLFILSNLISVKN